MTTKTVVGAVDVGPGGFLSEKHTICFNFHDFENLNHERGKCVKSSSIPCHGHSWFLKLFPLGKAKSNEDDVHVSIYLCKVHTTGDSSTVAAKYCLPLDSACISKFGRGTSYFNDCGNGFANFIRRADLLDRANNYLENGTLAIEVDIQVFTDRPSVWAPSNTLKTDMLKMLNTAKFADVTFAIGRTKIAAHQNILAFRAPSLFALTEDAPPNTDIEIEGVDPSVFKWLVHFIYSDELPPFVILKRNARALLEVADLFDCTGLKLLAEAELASSGITVATAAELLLLADSKNCALLKEAATKFFSANPAKVVASKGWAKVKESAELMAELMETAFPSTAKRRKTRFDGMDVSTLRRKLDEKGLDVDGTREMLVKRLKTSPK